MTSFLLPLHYEQKHKKFFYLRIDDIALTVKMKEENFVTMTVEMRYQKTEEPTVTVESKLCQKLEERLKKEHETFGDSRGSFEDWKKNP